MQSGKLVPSLPSPSFTAAEVKWIVEAVTRHVPFLRERVLQTLRQATPDEQPTAHDAATETAEEWPHGRCSICGGFEPSGYHQYEGHLSTCAYFEPPVVDELRRRMKAGKGLESLTPEELEKALAEPPTLRQAGAEPVAVPSPAPTLPAHDPRYFDSAGNYLDGPHWGKDCPKGKVQIEFLGANPKLQFSPYSWKPEDHIFMDVYVDGERYNIQIGDFEASTASGKRRGLSICGPIDLQVDKHSINAVDLFRAESASSSAPLPVSRPQGAEAAASLWICTSCGHSHYVEDENDSLPLGKCRMDMCECRKPTYSGAVPAAPPTPEKE